jgi:HEAT repeat protein
MKPERLNNPEDLVHHYLEAIEIDAFIIAELRRIEQVESLLINLVEGKSKTNRHHVKAAIYVLGILRTRDAIPTLLQVLKQDRISLQITTLQALGNIGIDEAAKSALMNISRDRDTEPALVAYALKALFKTGDSNVAEEIEKNPPAHANDSGVREILFWIKRQTRTS